ncbi:hypothetical protein [Roseospira visakhapatnamensis]|uniref:ArsR family transcriptional regulator n=1 Tax=Roseospira visakhapatnamensis TaxID=390880 RepID=A0A7W6RGI6_9PROT|nr:hypothetical protein [Roseospira visakhapatnamensis]MBB4268165.1 hypothetical protein [Roseospira visakhapatnamensis]
MAAKEQRLLILRALLDTPAREMNDGMARTALDFRGHRLGIDRVRILLAWLRDAGCIEIEDLDRYWVVTLTPLGAEVVRAETILPGIAHPMDVR